MAESFSNFEQKFKTPEEELDFLRKEVSRKEKELLEDGNIVNREKILDEKIEEYRNTQNEQKLDKNYIIPEKDLNSIVLELSPENHDSKMSELINILQDKGIFNTLSVIGRLKDPHLEDDFHRFLVQYIKAGFPISNIKERNPIFKALKMTLFEVSLPEVYEDEQKGKNLKEIISKMEQFYSGMFSVTSEEKDNSGYFVLELANSSNSNEIIFYISVPDSKKVLFEKQLVSIFSDVRIVEKKDDYNIFNEGGDYVGSYAELSTNDILPIKTYDQYDYDPLKIILNSFSKVDKETEGAAIQIIVKPSKTEKMSFFKKVLKEMEKGLKFKDALKKADSSFLIFLNKFLRKYFSQIKKMRKKRIHHYQIKFQ